MNASILDLRYKSKAILAALERREKVTILYHGKRKGEIFPLSNSLGQKVKHSPFFGMLAGENVSVSRLMKKLRGPRTS